MNLLPCPFPSCVSRFGQQCITTEELGGGYVTECQHCCGGTGTFTTPEEAEKEWNSVASLQQRLETAEAALQACKRYALRIQGMSIMLDVQNAQGIIRVADTALAAAKSSDSLRATNGGEQKTSGAQPSSHIEPSREDTITT